MNMSNSNKQTLSEYLGDYTFHVFSSQHFILEFNEFTQKVLLHPLTTSFGPQADQINFGELELEDDFEKITVTNDEATKVIELFNEENKPKLRFEYITHLSFNPVYQG